MSTGAAGANRAGAGAGTNSYYFDDSKPYLQIKLTKDILLQFDKQTRMPAQALIAEYLKRCAQVPGSITDLLSSSSSDEDSDGDDDDDYYDEEEVSDNYQVRVPAGTSHAKNNGKHI